MLGVLSAIKGIGSSGPFSPRKIIFEIEKEGGKTFEHMLNPTEYKVGRKVSWKCQPGDPGKNGGTQFYAFSAGQDTLSFSVVLDCSEEYGVDLMPEIEALYDFTYPFTEDADQPSTSKLRAQLITIHWGKFKFTGVVDSVDFTVNLFDPDGRMKRATATLAMQGTAFDKIAGEDFFHKEGARTRSAHYKGGDPIKGVTNMDISDPSAADKLLAKIGI